MSYSTILFVIFLLNVLSSWYLFEWAWKRTQRVRIIDDKRDALFPAFRRSDAKLMAKWRHYTCVFTGVFALRLYIGVPFFVSSALYSKIFLTGHDRSTTLTGLRFRIIRVGFAFYSWAIVTLLGWYHI